MLDVGTVKIRKIIVDNVGTPEGVKQIQFGVREKRAGGSEKGDVCSIEEDREYLKKYGRRRFLVFAEINGEACIWKEVIDPCIVEYYTERKENENHTRQNTGHPPQG